jgi:hypothetical protein
LAIAEKAEQIAEFDIIYGRMDSVCFGAIHSLQIGSKRRESIEILSHPDRDTDISPLSRLGPLPGRTADEETMKKFILLQFSAFRSTLIRRSNHRDMNRLRMATSGEYGNG